MSLKRKKLLTAAAVLLLTGIYIMIFRFSADDGDTSSDISIMVTKKIMNLYYRLTGQAGGTVIVPYGPEAWEGTVRKLAHFTEYMAVGFLSCGIAVMWMKKKYAGIWIVTVQLILSASLDELHQYFVPGRYASAKDVLIDTIGGMAGILIIVLSLAAVKKWKKKRQTV